MTTQELNRDIKRLQKTMRQQLAHADNNEAFDYFGWIEKTAKPEFTRLYYADKEMKYMNAASIRIMFRLNLRHRFFALHTFGLNIEL